MFLFFPILLYQSVLKKKNTSYKFLLDEVEANNKETSIIDYITEVVKES